MAKRKYNAGVSIDKLVFNKAIGEAAAARYVNMTTISRDEALNIGKNFAALVRDEVDPGAIVYVFGSTIKQTANLESDVDIAVISGIYGDDIIMEGAKLSMLADKINWRIEPHVIVADDWHNCSEPFIYEVQNTGVSV
jgi:predicted nucleotidyltransferase